MSQSRFEQLFADHARDVLAYTRRRTDAATADDIAAAVFEVAWKRLDQVPVDEPVLWLYGVARRLTANERRAARRRAALTLALRMVTQEEAPPCHGDGNLLQALAALRPADREVLLLSAWEDLDVRQIGVVLSCSQAAVHARLSRARRRLRTQLGARGNVPHSGPLPNEACSR